MSAANQYCRWIEGNDRITDYDVLIYICPRGGNNYQFQICYTPRNNRSGSVDVQIRRVENPFNELKEMCSYHAFGDVLKTNPDAIIKYVYQVKSPTKPGEWGGWLFESLDDETITNVRLVMN